MRSRLYACALGGCLFLAGCIEHRIDTTVPEDVPGAEGGTWIGDGERPLGPAANATVRHALPQTLAVDAWRWQVGPDGHSRMVRCSTVLRTPLPWWETFPWDLPADYIPVTFYARRLQMQELTPVPAMEPEALAAEARAAGFFITPRSAP